MSDGRPQRDWRSGAAAGPGPTTDKKSSVFVAGLLAVTLAGALAGIAYWLVSGGEPAVKYIALPLSEHTHPAWPPVPFAEADAKRLLRHFPGGELAFNNQEEVQFKQKLESLKSLRDSRVVLHIPALCVVHEGKPYLISSKAEPGQVNGSWHLLADVLAAFGACPASEKLLILDVIHPVARADRGVIADTSGVAVNGYLKLLADEKKLPGLVMVACSPGEFPLLDEVYRTSAFAGYLDEGLRGYADGQIEGTRDRWVRVRELHGHVRDRLSRWANFTRGVTQTVTLYGEGDFRLVSHDKVMEAEQPGPPVAYPAYLAAAWDERDAWDAAGLREKAPHLIHRFDRMLLQLEERHRAGVTEEKLKRELADARGGLTSDWERYKALPAGPRTSMIGTPAPVGLLAKIETFLTTYDGKKKLAEALGEPKPTPEAVLLAGWLQLGDQTWSRDQVAGLCAELVPPGSRPECAEAVFVAKLTELAAKRPFQGGERAERTWPRAAIQAATRAEQTYLEAAAAVGTAPEAYRWFRGRWDQLDKDREAAEAVLWTLGDDGLVGAASAASDTLNRYKSIDKLAGELRDDAKRAASAYRAFADAAAELPGLAAALPPLPAGDVAGQWLRAAQAATEIANIFDQSEPPTGFAERLAVATAAIQYALKAVRAHVAALAARDPDGRVTAAVVATPRLTGKDRVNWWNRRATWTANKEKWYEANASQLQSGEPILPPEWLGPEGERAGLRGVQTVALLQLAGQSVGPFATEVAELAAKRDPFGWGPVGGRLLAMLTSPSTEGQSALADRMGRVFGTTDAPARAACRVRREFYSAVAERYEREARSRGQVRLPYYLKAAQDARAVADAARTAQGS